MAQNPENTTERRNRKQTTRETTGKFFYNLSLGTFIATVVAFLSPEHLARIESVEDITFLLVLGASAGLLFAILFAVIAYRILNTKIR